MTERFRRVNYGNLEIQITVRQLIVVDDELIEFIARRTKETSHT